MDESKDQAESKDLDESQYLFTEIDGPKNTAKARRAKLGNLEVLEREVASLNSGDVTRARHLREHAVHTASCCDRYDTDLLPRFEVVFEKLDGIVFEK
jgi:hypothetical protein